MLCLIGRIYSLDNYIIEATGEIACDSTYLDTTFFFQCSIRISTTPISQSPA